MLEFDLKNCLNWKFVGHFPPNQTVGAKNVPTLRDPIMSRYYHVKLVSELKNRFPHLVVSDIVCLLLGWSNKHFWYQRKCWIWPLFMIKFSYQNVLINLNFWPRSLCLINASKNYTKMLILSSLIWKFYHAKGQIGAIFFYK